VTRGRVRTAALTWIPFHHCAVIVAVELFTEPHVPV